MFCNSNLKMVWQFLFPSTINHRNSCSLADCDSGSPGNSCETAFSLVYFCFE